VCSDSGDILSTWKMWKCWVRGLRGNILIEGLGLGKVEMGWSF
jgi:hypothetical protein